MRNYCLTRTEQSYQYSRASIVTYMMDKVASKICRLIKERPDYREILERAIQLEENPPDDFVKKYGWEWHQVGAHPGKLTKLVSEGILKVEYKSRRYTHYKLVDLETVKEALITCPINLEKKPSKEE